MSTNDDPIYAGLPRVSLEKQANEGYSLDAQVEEFTTIGERWKVRIPRNFIIEDDGYSGANFNRPAIRQALQWGREGKIRGVAWTHVDRFARDVEGGLRLIRTFREAGLEVLLGNLGVVRDDAQFIWQMQQFLSMAQYMKSDILAKSRSGVRQKLREGTPHGGAPYGYRLLTKTEVKAKGSASQKKYGNQMVRVEAEIKIVILIFELSAKGLSFAQIIQELDARAIPAPRKGKRATAGLWRERTIGGILHRDDYYTGIWHYNKTQRVEPENERRIRRKTDRHILKTTLKLRPKSEWMPVNLPDGPIISEALYEQAQASIKRNMIVSSGRPSATNILTGLGKCGHCNFNLAYSRRHGHRYLRCNHRENSAKGGAFYCHVKSLRAELVEEGIMGGIEDGIVNDLDRLVAAYRERNVVTDPAELARCRAEEEKLSRKMTEAAHKELEEDDANLKKFYSDRVREIKGTLQLLRRRIAAVAAESKPINVDTKQIASYMRLALKTKDPKNRRQILLKVVDQYTLTDGVVELTLRIPVGGLEGGRNSEQHVDDVQSLILLKIKGRVDSGKWERVA